MKKFYTLKVGALTRQLPLVKINKDTMIANFMLLGDDQMARTAARMLAKKVDLRSFDYIATVESNGVPLAHDLSLLADRSRSIVIRKKVRNYMAQPLKVPVSSLITSGEELVLDGRDAQRVKDKKVMLVDDVINTGSTMAASELSLKKAGASVVGRLAVIAEGPAAFRRDIQYLAEMPLFNTDGTPRE